MLALLERLIGVATPSPGGDELGLAGLLEDELRARRPDELQRVEVPRSGGPGAYVYARWGAPRLILNAHLDTVPPNAGWTGDPYRARYVNDGIMGLGAADTKGAIAAILAAMDEAAPKNCLVLFSGDEELGGACLRAFVASGAADTAERAIVCEPTGCRPGTRHRGVCAFDIEFTGMGGHSSKADDLPAPLAQAAHLAMLFRAWGQSLKDVGPPGFPGLCVNIAKIDGGVAFNVVPKTARLSISVRPGPGIATAQILEEVGRIVAAVEPAATVSTVLDNPSFATRDLEAFRPLLGDRVDAPVNLGFWTEAAVLAAEGIDAVVFGPGDIGRAHAADEWVATAELECARAVLAQVLGRHGAG